MLVSSLHDCSQERFIGVQEGLIGHERERRGDERLRAAAHAEWLAQQDEADVQRLMDGMKNGFRQPKRPAFFLDAVRTFGPLTCMTLLLDFAC